MNKIDDVLCEVCSLCRDNKGCGNCKNTCLYLKKAKQRIGDVILSALEGDNCLKLDGILLKTYISKKAIIENLKQLGLMKEMEDENNNQR